MSFETRSQGRLSRAAAVALLLIIFFLSGYRSAEYASVTFDEFAHVPAGVAYWKKCAFYIYPHNPPLGRLISTLPIFGAAELPPIDPVARIEPEYRWTFAEDFMLRNLEQREHSTHQDGPGPPADPAFSSYHRLIFKARLPVLILGVLLGGLIFLWSRRLFGYIGGLLSLGLYCFCPNMLAHASVATTDLATTFFVTLAMYAAYEFHEHRGRTRLCLAGAGFGLAMLTKFTALIALPAAMLLIAVPNRSEKILVARPRRVWVRTAVFLFFVWAVFCAGYCFTGMFRPLGSMPLHWDVFMKVKAVLPDRTPVPFPSDAIMGLDSELVRSGRHLGVFYLLSRLSREGWFVYFPIALLVKTPIPILILWVVAFLPGIRRFVMRWNPGVTFSLIFPPLFFLVFFVLMKGSNYGIRYVLVCFPFLYILSGVILENLRNLWIRVGLVLLLIWHAAGSLCISPYYLAYFNEAAGGPKGGIRILADSNLDWGQQLKVLRRYMDKRGVKEIALSYTGPVDPKVYGISWKPVVPGETRGLAAISANHLIGFFPMGGIFGNGIQDLSPFLNQNPEAVIAESMYIYDLK